MPGLTAADTIRILVATDNHVGYNERDAIRGDDSWKSFHEIMCLAKERDVDMVLLAGDLFHDNKPSRKSMFQVMRSLRMNCYGEKPCELELLSDSSEVFQGAFNHVNYEDPDINVAIPVFSIHGNHDDPSGEGHLAALDLLQAAGLVNYYGRTPESDNIQIKPVLLQKGRTKLALYGMSNVRDERLFRTFRDGKVKFFQPGTQKDNWFNLMSVHQNHHAYTEKGFLPENFLPGFLDLVIWGHEHECLINPTYNAEMNFHVMQPGSSVATSLMPGEAVPKHVAILNITGRDYKVEPIRLKTVRPFVMKEIVLAEEKEAARLAKKANNRTELTKFLETIVNRMIDQAKADWEKAQGDEEEPEEEAPLPLIRLRVEFTAPEGGNFDCENPQRFSNRFNEKVANVTDVVQFHRRKTVNRKAKDDTELPEAETLASLEHDTVRVEKIIREFLSAQSLTILPQNSFSDAVGQYVDKDDKSAMEGFVAESLKKQNLALAEMDHGDEDNLEEAMGDYKSKLEELFASGQIKMTRKKPRPEAWDSDIQGDWSDDPQAIIRSDEEAEPAEPDSDEVAVAQPPTKSRAKAAPARKTAAAKPAAPVKKPAPAKTSRGKKKVFDDSDDDEADVIMVDDDSNDENNDNDNDGESQLFNKPMPPTRASKKAAPAPAKKLAPRRAAASTSAKQSQLNFSQAAPATKTRGKTVQPMVNDDISDDDDDDAFEPAPSAPTTRARR